MALFLAQLAALTGLGRYEEQARQALRPIPALLADLAGHPDQAAMVGPGGFEGLGGVAYALARLAVLLGDAEVLGWVEPAVELTGAALGASGPGLLTGDAGAVAAMLAVHRATGLAAAYETARRAADRLLTAHPGGDPGFADGYAGVVWALNRFGHPVPVPATAASARRGWCEGTAGLALAGTPGAVDALLRAVPLANHSLCHGELGVLGALAVAASGGHAGAAAALPARTAHLLGAVETHGPRCGTPGGVDSPGLLTGLAGIGYGLLRLGFPDRVPSVLLLDVAPAPIRQPQGGGSQP